MTKLILIQLSATLLLATSCGNSTPNSFKTTGGKEINPDQLDKFIEGTMDSMKIPAISIAIIENSEIVYHNAFGVKSVETKEKVDHNTLFEGASISKPLFAYFVMKQVDKGLLNLDKPLFEYIPYKEIGSDERFGLITARMVLSHSSGLPNWRPKNKELNIDFDPGTRFQYSGEGYEYLARVLATIKKTDIQGLYKCFKEEVADPLDAIHLHYDWNMIVAENKSTGHADGKATDNGPFDGRPENEFGAAYSLHSEAMSYSKFILAMIQGQGLSVESFNEMLESQIELHKENFLRKVFDYSSWSLGFGIQETSQGKIFSHHGNNGDANAYCHFSPNMKNGIVLFTNSDAFLKSKFLAELSDYLGYDIYINYSALSEN